MWDVEAPVENIREFKMHISSPRILMMISDTEYNMLLDSGSEVTCISEQLYKDLRQNNNFLEMPVANVAIHGAVSSKQTTVKKQSQLIIRIGSQEVRFPSYSES